MVPPCTRREFMHRAALAAAAGSTTLRALGADETAPSAATRPATAPAKERAWKLGLDTFTFHRTLTARDPANRRDIWWIIDLAHEHGLEGLQIDPSHFPGDDETTLKRLASVVGPRHMYIEFGMGGWDPTRMRHRIELTARFGGKALRTFCGGEVSTQEQIENYLKWAPPALHDAADAAEKHSVYIAVENHGDFTAEQMKRLIEAADHPMIGVCFDTGNALFRKENPLACARTLAPITRSMHLKDWRMSFDEGGHPVWKETPFGEGEGKVEAALGIIDPKSKGLYIAIENPVAPSDDEAETVQREMKHFLHTVEAAKDMLRRV